MKKNKNKSNSDENIKIPLESYLILFEKKRKFNFESFLFFV